MESQGITLGEFLEFKEQLNKIISVHPATKANRFLTRKEVAHILNVSLPTLHEWTKSGKITGFRIGSRVLYKSGLIEQSLIQINHKHTKGVDNGKS